MVILNRWFLPRSSGADRLRFWRTYYQARQYGVWHMGPAGPRGPAGAQGPPGSPGTARAYGVANGAGVLDSTRSKAIAGVSKPPSTVGVYCIALATGINPASTTIVASPNNADPSSSSRAIAQVDTSAPDCPAGSLEIEMRRVALDTTVSPPQVVAHHADNGFSFIVP